MPRETDTSDNSNVNGEITMTEVNLEDMPLNDLKALQKKITKTIDSYQDRQKLQALAALEAKAKELGFSLSDLVDAPTGKTKRKAASPKYRHPEDASTTWTGKGRQPAWFKQAVESGVAPEDLLI